MTNQILDFSDKPAMLRSRNGLLVVCRDEGEVTIPLADISVIVASHRQVVFTQAVVTDIARNGGVLICCNERHHPSAMLLPLEQHYQQAERFQKQAVAALPVKKRIWKEIVREKVSAQGRVLAACRDKDAGLLVLSGRVRSGDSGNLEAVAAQRYWPKVFGDPGFRRGDAEDPRNGLLNYGYAIVRAMTARALCAAGLHPSLGVHHHNRANAFCLADDLMEPCRPLVDLVVVRWCEKNEESDWAVGKEQKRYLLENLSRRFRVAGEARTLFDILTRTAQSMASVLTGERREFHYPKIDVG